MQMVSVRRVGGNRFFVVQLLTFILICVNDFETVGRNMGNELKIQLYNWENSVIPACVQTNPKYFQIPHSH